MAGFLKIKPEYFQAVIDERKPFEIRNNDRNFKAGEKYILEEFNGIREVPECPCYPSACDALDFEQDEECSHPLRRSCSSYTEEVYTGRRCLIRIKEVFPLDNAGLAGYVAFTFDILNIIDDSTKGGRNA